MTERAVVVVLMGVAGAGKTTIGRALAKTTGARFVDADDLHPPENVAKMRSGAPLDDDDRAPWLARVRGVVEEAIARGERLVVACSALKEAYRRTIARENEPIRFVALDAPRGELRRRLAGRRGHFFDGRLLDSQLDALEPPAHALVVDATRPVDEVVDAIARALDPGHR